MNEKTKRKVKEIAKGAVQGAGIWLGYMALTTIGLTVYGIYLTCHQEEKK